MRFSAATLVAILAGNALAGPVVASTPVDVRDVAVADQSNETMVENAILFAVHPDADCSITSCAGVLASAACIALNILKKNPAGLIKCVSGGASKICGCAGCVDKLGDFLTEHHICS
ncbi:hypothetical protein PG990_008877 [Apiospora arundinis]|uniref:Uncharacterized protein n=1 Tax=Apiospora arundinis TaxID=335852 RepID=A0ABR2IRV3_9PEZI